MCEGDDDKPCEEGAEQIDEVIYWFLVVLAAGPGVHPKQQKGVNCYVENDIAY